MKAPVKRERGPAWLRAIYRVERAVGEPLESALHSDAYFDLISELLRARARTGRTLEWGSRRVLHLLNLPAGSDMRRMREQLGRVERRLAQVSKELEETARAAEARPGGR